MSQTLISFIAPPLLGWNGNVKLDCEEKFQNTVLLCLDCVVISQNLVLLNLDNVVTSQKEVLLKLSSWVIKFLPLSFIIAAVPFTWIHNEFHAFSLPTNTGATLWSPKKLVTTKSFFHSCSDIWISLTSLKQRILE